MSIEKRYELLKSRVDYDRDTGSFVWRRVDGMPRMWITKHAGKQAGTVDSKGRVVLHVLMDKKSYRVFAHRLAWFIVHGILPDCGLDHIDGNPLNNAISNLRDVTASVNMRNVPRYSRNTSGYCGVSWRKSTRRWDARVMVSGHMHNLGSYANIADADAAVRTFRAANGFTDRHGTPISFCR